jgi:glycosyltransferase involved in cell wall biosynthesis
VKILLVHNRRRSLLPSGENLVVDQEAEALAGAGHEVQRFERRSDDTKASTLLQKATLAASSVWNARAIGEVRDVIARSRPDVVHVHNVFPMLSPSVLVGCRQEGVPAVVTFHNYGQVCSNGMLFRAGKPCLECVGHSPLPALKHGCYKGSLVATAPMTTGLVVQRHTWRAIPSGYVFLSESQKELFSSLGWPPERCFVKANLAPSVGKEAAHRDRVVYIGRLHEVKGLRHLMRAWDAFTDSHPASRGGLELVIAGSGPLEPEIRAWAAKKPSVRALGLLPRDECAALLSEARLAVVPSAWLEPFGMVVIEAMAAGVAVVAPGHGAFPELVTQGVDGVLYPPGDVEALAAVFSDAVRRPTWFDDLGRAGRLKFASTYRADLNVAQLEEIYRFVIKNPRFPTRN